MSESAFIKSSPRIDQLVNSATSYEELREQVKHELEVSGVIQRDANDPYNGTLLRKPEMDSPAAVVAEPVDQRPSNCYRVIYPFQNDRYELTGRSEEELDQKEARIRAALGLR